MFHLSKELTGVVLPHDTYGFHLDSGGKTIDVELEMRNFEAAGEVLSDIWSELEIDGYQVHAEYVKEKPMQEIICFEPSKEFKRDHVFESQYQTVYLKCKDQSCCSEFKTNVESFFPHRRIPALIPIKRTCKGVEASDGEQEKIEFLSLSERVLFEKSVASQEMKSKYGTNIPYDICLPSLQQDEKVDKRVCDRCGKYHSTQKSLGQHKKVCKIPKPKKVQRIVQLIDNSDSEEEENNNQEEEVDEDEQPSNLLQERPQFSVTVPGEFVEQILNIREWLKSPWALESDPIDA